MINILSGVLLSLFLLSYYLKLLSQKRENIDAFKLGKGEKESKNIEKLAQKFTFSWAIVWLMEVLYSDKIELHFRSFFDNEIVRYTGVVLCLSGLTIFCMAMITMKNSWRVGIDKETKTEFIKNGVYKFSRNPAFVGFDLMFTGLFLTYSNLIVLIICIMNITVFHLLILKEEKHLSDSFGKDYEEYKKSVKRYFGW